MKQLLASALLCISMAAGAQLPKASSGEIKRIEKFPSKHVDARNIDVWLPAGYSPAKKYAVLYMHDGQMLYDSTTTWNKQEWMVDEVATKLTKEEKIRDIIVVGIWNNNTLRHAEYFPEKALKNLAPDQRKELLLLIKEGPKADSYLRFLVTELKPYIDKTFATLPDQQNTFIAGSSMGGLISLYAICEYPKVFGGAACLSTHWIGKFNDDNNPIPPAIIKYMQAKLPSPKTHKLYFDYGNKTLDQYYKPWQLKVDALMEQKGFTSESWITKEFVGEDHSERAWQRRLHIPFEFLMAK
ncbi:alpha/beta hydrolase [Acetobacteroides hydrogenigenes]|uniref:Putative esterase n=1 Tax=Acetobacteroides hydrogenigenes TaxID=979970 RepID=A0A4R2EAT2_9BACT|nr:alpha/beta hydrolase-fold protein [Acetobacteroides hydrogenigenes]TCN65413.1 putative esterase [Acetobacteroides hydrogenigenes]